MIKNIITNFKKYKFLLFQLVSRDFKVKYKRSVLGVVWSILYPVLTMSVMALVFTNMFKASMPGVNYLVYLMTGLVIFNYFSEASNLAMSSVVGNFSLLNKVYIPKYIFPLSKCIFVALNLALTLIPLYALILITGTGVNIYHLLLPFVFICLILFTIGMGLILSAVAVFFRDLFYIYSVLLQLWAYMTPVMYDFSIIPENLQLIFKFNPLYWFVKFARDIILYGVIPNSTTWICCIISSLVVLIAGLVIFKKNQDKFIYYV